MINIHLSEEQLERIGPIGSAAEVTSFLEYVLSCIFDNPHLRGRRTIGNWASDKLPITVKGSGSQLILELTVDLSDGSLSCGDRLGIGSKVLGSHVGVVIALPLIDSGGE